MRGEPYRGRPTGGRPSEGSTCRTRARERVRRPRRRAEIRACRPVAGAKGTSRHLRRRRRSAQCHPRRRSRCAWHTERTRKEGAIPWEVRLTISALTLAPRRGSGAMAPTPKPAIPSPRPGRGVPAGALADATWVTHCGEASGGRGRASSGGTGVSFGSAPARGLTASAATSARAPTASPQSLVSTFRTVVWPSASRTVSRAEVRVACCSISTMNARARSSDGPIAYEVPAPACAQRTALHRRRSEGRDTRVAPALRRAPRRRAHSRRGRSQPRQRRRR
jgi:hypothetical protein